MQLMAPLGLRKCAEVAAPAVPAGADDARSMTTRVGTRRRHGCIAARYTACAIFSLCADFLASQQVDEAPLEVVSVGNAPSTGHPEREGGQAYGSRKATVREAPDPMGATGSVRFVGPSEAVATVHLVAPGRPRLATQTEALVADALDRARVLWRYEPTRFVIARHVGGLEREACAPDFYLPALDLYLEVSNGSPRRLNRKRAKLRRLAEAHPGIRVELLGPLEIAELEHDPARYVRRLAGTIAA